MKNLHAFIWSMETYSKETGEVVKRWKNIQLIFEITPATMKLLGLPLKKEYSMYSAYWVSGNKKLLSNIIPDDIILDNFSSQTGDKSFTNIDGSLHIPGRFGLLVRQFSSYSEKNPNRRIYTVNEETAKENNQYINNHDRGSTFIKKAEKLEEIHISNQAIIYLICLIGRDLIWEGRGYKFKVLQYTSEMKDKEIKELINRQLSWIDVLCDHFKVSKDHPVIEVTRKLLSVRPDESYDDE